MVHPEAERKWSGNGGNAFLELPPLGHRGPSSRFPICLLNWEYMSLERLRWPSRGRYGRPRSCPYKADVGGSSPSTPTKKALLGYAASPCRGKDKRSAGREQDAAHAFGSIDQMARLGLEAMRFAFTADRSTEAFQALRVGAGPAARMISRRLDQLQSRRDSPTLGL